jgi:hypothetical protein
MLKRGISKSNGLKLELIITDAADSCLKRPKLKKQ